MHVYGAQTIDIICASCQVIVLTRVFDFFFTLYLDFISESLYCKTRFKGLFIYVTSCKINDSNANKR